MRLMEQIKLMSLWQLLVLIVCDGLAMTFCVEGLIRAGNIYTSFLFALGAFFFWFLFALFGAAAVTKVTQ